MIFDVSHKPSSNYVNYPPDQNLDPTYMRTIFLVKSSEQFRSPARKQNNWGGLTFGLGNTTHFGGS